MILLISERCAIKLACTVAGNLASSLSPGGIVLKVVESRDRTSYLLCRQQQPRIDIIITVIISFSELSKAFHPDALCVYPLSVGDYSNCALCH